MNDLIPKQTYQRLILQDILSSINELRSLAYLVKYSGLYCYQRVPSLCQSPGKPFLPHGIPSFYGGPGQGILV